MPPLAVLAEPKKAVGRVSNDALEQNARMLEGVLDDFGVKGEIINIRPGPVVTLYELEPAPGVKSSRVIGLADDIARSMSAVSARVAVVQGRNAIGIELPNQRREMVYLRELVASEDFEKSKHRLAIALGKTIGGEPVIVDLARMPHLLVAGTTGSGKSVAINTMILSLLYRLKPEQCRLIMVDPKMLELSAYDGIPHLLTPVVTDPKKAVVALKWAVREMEDRYKKMSKVGVRNIDGFNARVGEALAKGEALTRTVQTGFDRETGEAIYEREELALEALPYIVLVVDEMADLMMVAGKDIEGAIQRLAQMARAAGIHLIMATQRPSVDVVTGTIKANFPTRISFQVTSKIDSRTILGEQGARAAPRPGRHALHGRRRAHLPRARAVRVRPRGREGGRPPQEAGLARIPARHHRGGRGAEDEDGPPPVRGLDGRRRGRRLLRPRGQHRAARPESVDELHPAPPVGRLQQGRLAGRADGEGGRGQPPEPLRKARDPGRERRRPRRLRGSRRGLSPAPFAAGRPVSGCRVRDTDSSSDISPTIPRYPGLAGLRELVLACSATSARLAAVLIRARWENACGKLPSCRFPTGSYSSASRPTSLRSASSRSNNAARLGDPAGQRVVVGEPEAAGEEGAFARQAARPSRLSVS